MIRKIVEISEEKCSGCGACADACHEGAIVMINGKAKLIRDDYCDGLGDCLPACPDDAIRIIEREAAAYDEEAVAAHIASREGSAPAASEPARPSMCPGSMSMMFERSPEPVNTPVSADMHDTAPVSRLAQWPCQIKLLPVRAPYFEGCHLLLAADCTAFSYGNFHEEFMKGRVTVVGCPKLDMIDYSEKLCEIIKQNDIKSVTLVRMEVPCCGGLEHALVTALRNSGKVIPWQVHVISCDGNRLS